MEPSLSRELGGILQSLNQTLQQMRLSIEDLRRQPVTGGFASAFAPIAPAGQLLNAINAGNLYAPDRFTISPRITLLDLLYTRWRGVPVYRPYVTPSELMQAQGMYATLMGANAAALAGYTLGTLVGFANPVLGITISAATAGLQGLYANYILRFPEIEQTRQVLSPHFSQMTRTGYKGLTLSEAQQVMSTIIDLSMESAAFGVAELRDLTARIARTNLLAGVRTVQDFRERMRELMNSVREITGALHISYEDAINLLSELTRHGLGPQRASQLSYFMRNLAAGMGVNPGVLTSSIMQNIGTYTQMGMTAAGALNVATLGPALLAALRTYLPADVYNRLGISGRQEEVLSGLQQGFTRLLSDNMFQMALLGAERAGLRSWTMSYNQLLSQGAAVIQERPYLANPYARMAYVSEVLERNPEFIFAAARQYVGFYADIYRRMGATDREAYRTAVQRVFGISQPGLAETVANALQTLEPWQLPVAISSMDELAQRELMQDRMMYQRQDYVAQAVKRFISTINIFSRNWVGWRALNEAIWRRLSWGNYAVGPDYLSAFIGGMVGAVDTFLPTSISFANTYFGATAWQRQLEARQLENIARAYNIGTSGQQFLDVLARAGIARAGDVNATVANFIAALATSQYTNQLIHQLGLRPTGTVALQLGVGQYAALGLDPKVIEQELKNIDDKLSSGLEVKITDEIKISRTQWNELSTEFRRTLAALRYTMTNATGLPAGEVAGKIVAVEQLLTQQGLPPSMVRYLMEWFTKFRFGELQQLDLNDPESVNRFLRSAIETLNKEIQPTLRRFSSMNLQQLQNYFNRLRLPVEVERSLPLLTGPTPDYSRFEQIAKRYGLTDAQILDIYALAISNPRFARLVAERNNWTLSTTGQVIPYQIPESVLLGEASLQRRITAFRRVLGGQFRELDAQQLETIQSAVSGALQTGGDLRRYAGRLRQMLQPSRNPLERIFQPTLYDERRHILSQTPEELLPIAFLMAYVYRGARNITVQDAVTFLNNLRQNPRAYARMLDELSDDKIRQLLNDRNFSTRMLAAAGLLELPVLQLLQTNIATTPRVTRMQAWSDLARYAGLNETQRLQLPTERSMQTFLERIEFASRFSDPRLQKAVVDRALQEVRDQDIRRYFGNRTREDLSQYIVEKMLAPTTSEWNRLSAELQNSNRVNRDLVDATRELTTQIEKLNNNIEVLLNQRTRSNPRVVEDTRVFQGFINK